MQVGILALVGDHSTVPLTQISCNTIFSKSQNERKVGTLCIVQRKMYAIFLSHISHWNTGTYNNHRTIQIAKVICFSEAVGPVPPERPNSLTAMP